MNNQLLKNQNRYLYTEYGQDYAPAIPARTGYWRTEQRGSQTAWTPVTKVYGRPMMGAWSITLSWYDRFKSKNMQWYGEAFEGQPINIPYASRYSGGREEIEIQGPAQTVQVWVPPTPGVPERPFIPDRHVYEDNSGWNAGARAVRSVQRHGVIHWSMSPQARGVVVGMSRTPAAGAYWQYLVGVRAEEGVAKVVVAGVDVAHLGRFSKDTKFRIAYTQAALEVYVDDVLQHTVLAPSDGPALLFDVSLYGAGDYIFNPAITAHHIGSVQGQFQRLQGIAFDELPGAELLPDEGVVFLQAAYLDGWALGEGQANDAASGTLGHLLGLATDLDELAFTVGPLPALQGQASGYRDLLPQEEPSNIYAGFARITALGAVTDTGVQQLAAPYLLGLASDEADVSVAFGYLPTINVLVQEENPDEDELWQRASARGRLQKHDVQVAVLLQRALQRGAMALTNVGVAAWSTSAAVHAGFAVNQLASVAMQVAGRLTAAERSSLPGDDLGVTVLSCHESGGYVTHYSSYNFDAFAQIGGRYYGVAADGVYLLEGESDEGREITARIDFGTQKLSSAELKSIPSVYAGMASTQAATLVVGTRQGEYRYVQRGHAPRLQTQRFDLGRGLRDTHYDFALEVPAAGLELDNMEFGATKSTRRI